MSVISQAHANAALLAFERKRDRLIVPQSVGVPDDVGAGFVDAEDHQRAFLLGERKGIQKPRTNLRIRARFPVWLENSTSFFIVRTKAEHTRVLRDLRNRKRVDSARQAQFCPGMWRLPLILTLIASSALAQEEPTAYEALRVVGTQFNRAAIRRVLSVTGVDGAPQPATWKVMIADRNAPGECASSR